MRNKQLDCPHLKTMSDVTRYNQAIKKASMYEGKTKVALSEIAEFWQNKIQFTDDITCDFTTDGICLITEYEGNYYNIPISFIGHLENKLEITEEEFLKYSI